MISRLLACVAAAWLAFAPAAEASQATLVTPGAPLTMTGLASFLNSALLSIASQNGGTSAPANGPGGVPFTNEIWCNTTTNPTACNIYDGTNWVQYGSLDTAGHDWNTVGNSVVVSTVITSVFFTSAPTTLTGTSGTATSASQIINASGTFTLTLPTATGNSGRWIYVKSIAAQAVNSASSNVVPLGSATAGTAILTNTAGKYAWLQSDGTNWITMAAN